MRHILLLLLLLSCIMFSCRVTKIKNVVYNKEHNLLLDVYTPKKIKEPAKIMLYIYGGNWRSGNKKRYKFLGKGFARKGVACVIMNYRLNPKPIADMANDVAQAVKWTKENATTFNGDADSIYISGHSAGGHLAAMVTADNSYFEKLNMRNPVKGCVLIDAFGLDMHKYLTVSKSAEDSIYTKVFSNKPEQWKKLSPVNYLNKNTPPFLTLVGEKTYPAIIQLSDIFYAELKKFQPNAQLIIYKHKRHIPMIAQFYNARAKGYKDILEFMNSETK